MAEEKKVTLEREYVIPLRRQWMLVPQYRRAGRAAKAIKQFLAKHMKVDERDTDKVKLDMYLNNELWFRGKTNPPAKIKVKAVKEDGIVRVTFVETPQYVKFLKAKHERIHKTEEKAAEAPVVQAKVETKEEKIEEAKDKKDEVEKEKAGEIVQIKEAKREKLTAKHLGQGKAPEIKRTATNRH